MKIERNGAENDRGTYDTTLKIKLAVWDEVRNGVLLQAFHVPDFATNARHHWKMSMTLQEVIEIVKALNAGAQQSEAIRTGLTAEIIKPLLELALVAHSNVGASISDTAA